MATKKQEVKIVRCERERSEIVDKFKPVIAIFDQLSEELKRPDKLGKYFYNDMTDALDRMECVSTLLESKHHRRGYNRGNRVFVDCHSNNISISRYQYEALSDYLRAYTIRYRAISRERNQEDGIDYKAIEIIAFLSYDYSGFANDFLINVANKLGNFGYYKSAKAVRNSTIRNERWSISHFLKRFSRCPIDIKSANWTIGESSNYETEVLDFRKVD